MTILSQPRPSSSHIRSRRMRAASFSFLDFGGLSMILMISTKGIPGFVTSIRLGNISMMGPAPAMKKSWCMTAFAMASLIAGNGNELVVVLRTALMSSLEGSSVLSKCSKLVFY